MLFFLSTQFVEFLCAVLLVVHEALGEGTVLNVVQNSLHGSLDFWSDDTWTGHVVTVFCGVRAGPALLSDSTFNHEVNDELEFVQNLEVCDLGLVSGFCQGFKTGLNQVRNTTAQYGLFTEQVGFGFFCERGLDSTCAQTTNGLGVGQNGVPCASGFVLFNSDKHGDTSAVNKLTAHNVAGALRRNHDDVHAFRSLDVAKADVETVTEHQGLAGGQFVLDFVVVDVGLNLVGCKDDDDVSPVGNFAGGSNFEALRGGLVTAL